VSAPRSVHVRDEAGFSLPELLAAISIGMIVLLATFGLLDRSIATGNEIAMREETLQRGRQAMELITRQLRSQVCIGQNTPPIVSGDANALTLHVDLSDGSRAPERRRLVHDPVAGTITESREVGSGVVPNVTYTMPATSQVLVTNVQPAVGENVFRYYAFAAAGAAPGELAELPVPLSAADTARVVKIGVSFVTLPDRPVPELRFGTALRESIFVRSADTARQLGGPRCL
jgi:type II secretory pathway pseudopilin PulG